MGEREREREREKMTMKRKNKKTSEEGETAAGSCSLVCRLQVSRI